MTNKISRRNFIKSGALAVGALTLAGVSGGIENAVAAARGGSRPRSTVYFTKDLSPEGIRKLYAMVNQGITGRTAIKLHTGEPNGPNIIPQEWVRAFMPDVPNSAIVECNVLYSSPGRPRPDTVRPWKPMAGLSAPWILWMLKVTCPCRFPAGNG